MCAIIGFICSEPNVNAILTLKRVFIESKIRGMHAYGYSMVAKDGSKMTAKGPSLKTLLQTMPESPRLLIGHCRYSTSGDYKDNNNNQPLTYEGESLVFNGVIDMRTKAEMERAYGIKMLSDNDGEIMLQSKDRMALLKTDITYSGLVLKTNAVQFFRNEGRPGYKATRFGATYVASTADILRRCNLNPEVLTPHEVHEWTV
jgi:glutamine phosphoribosylpyrophosphate amidotransferase